MDDVTCLSPRSVSDPYQPRFGKLTTHVALKPQAKRVRQDLGASFPLSLLRVPLLLGPAAPPTNTCCMTGTLRGGYYDFSGASDATLPRSHRGFYLANTFRLRRETFFHFQTSNNDVGVWMRRRVFG